MTRAVTERTGGVSGGRWTGLNLAGHVGDDAAAVSRNRVLLAESLGLDPSSVIYMDQSHGVEVAVVEEVPERPPHADAMVCARPGVALVVLVADCTPVLLADPSAGVVAAAHAGRAGLLGGVVPAALAAMRDLGATDVTAVVGPSVCGRCYEVPERMRSDAARDCPDSRAVSWTGTPAIDVAAGVVAQLHEHGVGVRWLPGCTREDERFYSYRRDGATGRFGGVVVRRAA